MGVTISQLILGYYIEWDVKGAKLPVPTFISDENDFLDMMQAIQGRRREQLRLIEGARAKKQNTSEFKAVPKVMLIDLREASKAKVCRYFIYQPSITEFCQGGGTKAAGASKTAETNVSDTTELTEEHFMKEIEIESKCCLDGRVCIVYPDDRHKPAGHDIMLSWAHLCVRSFRSKTNCRH